MKTHLVKKKRTKSFETGHDKPNKNDMCPAKPKISLGILPVWSVSCCPQRETLGPWLLIEGSEDLSDWVDVKPDQIILWAQIIVGCHLCHAPAQYFLLHYDTQDSITRGPVVL